MSGVAGLSALLLFFQIYCYTLCRVVVYNVCRSSTLVGGLVYEFDYAGTCAGRPVCCVFVSGQAQGHLGSGAGACPLQHLFNLCAPRGVAHSGCLPLPLRSPLVFDLALKVGVSPDNNADGWHILHVYGSPNADDLSSDGTIMKVRGGW